MEEALYDLFGNNVEVHDKILTAITQDSWHPDLDIYDVVAIEFYTKTCKIFYTKNDNEFYKSSITIRMKDDKYQTNKIVRIDK